MNTFLLEASTSLTNLSQLIGDCSKTFVNTMKFYRFQPKDGKLENAQPKDFFCLWLPFCQDYKNSWKREQMRIEKEILQQERLKYKRKTSKLKDFKVEPRKPMGLKEKMLQASKRNK